MVIGINASKISYYEDEPWFRNVLQAGPGVREIAADGWRPDSGAIEFDAAGKIVHVPNKAVIRHNFGPGHKAGGWIVTYDGIAYYDWKFATTGSLLKIYHDGESEGHLTINVHEGQCPRKFAAFPVDGNTGFYRQGLIDDLRPFRVIRWMDAQQMKQPSLRHLVSRRQLQGFYGHPSYGISPEIIRDICLACGATPWINIHHSWPIEYVEEYLDVFDGMTCYVEGGNENWNTREYHGQIFGGNRIRALAHFMPAYEAAVERGHKCVLPTQEAGESGQLGKTKEMLMWVADHNKHVFSVVAGKSYFGNGHKYTGNDDEDFAHLQQRMEIEFDKIEYMRAYVQDELGLEYALYECGQSVNDPLAAAINRNPRMGEMYEQYAGYVKDTTDVACFYNHTFSPTGKYAFGLREYAGQTDSPKWDAVMRVIHEQPPEPKPNTMEEYLRKAIYELKAHLNTIEAEIPKESNE